MAKRVSDIVNQQRAALYIRVSTHWQVDKDSLPVQREELTNYCKYALGITSYEVFEDAGYSAKNTDRPAYQTMMARMRTGEFTHLIVWKLDRISRNLLDFAAMYEELKRLGITFVSKNEQFDTSSAMGEAMLKIILVFAELERKVTSERVTAIMYSRAANGQWNGGRVPFGYTYDKATKEFGINESERAVYEKMCSLYEETSSLMAVARSLNEMGLRSRSGHDWTPTTVSIVLKNPFYLGTYRYNYRGENGGPRNWVVKEESEWILVEDHHPKLIELERWEAISATLYKNRRSNKGGGSTYYRKNIHIFAGLLKCGRCGSYFQATIDRKRADGWRPSIYLCSRHRRYGDCDNKYISDVTLGPFVLNYIANIMKAQRSFGKTTSIETLEKKLLRGPLFADVEHIEGVGLQELYDMLHRGSVPTVEYTSKSVQESVQTAEAQERDLLAAERRRNERALVRLKNLFLYDDEAISEKDYILEQKRLTDAIQKIDGRLEEIEKNSSQHFELSDDEFISKASYFIMSQKLVDKREVNYESLVRKMDPKIVKDFINSICQNFCILDGRVESIRFKNGMEHRFLYRDR